MLQTKNRKCVRKSIKRNQISDSNIRWNCKHLRAISSLAAISDVAGVWFAVPHIRFYGFPDHCNGYLGRWRPWDQRIDWRLSAPLGHQHRICAGTNATPKNCNWNKIRDKIRGCIMRFSVYPLLVCRQTVAKASLVVTSLFDHICSSAAFPS